MALANQAIMTQTTEDIISAALSLPAETRVKLAERLLDSLQQTSRQEIDQAWALEAERRLDEYEEGKVATIAADHVLRPRESHKPS
jgi:putative addiction module component (TIGR02574 family)